jgi:hypothetical protein
MKRAETGFYARTSADATLRQLLGERSPGRARILFGWPSDLTKQGDFPRVTYFMASGAVRRPGLYTVRLQVDSWVWPSGDEGGPERLADIDSRLLILLDDAHWQHDGARLYAIALASRDFPAPPKSPLRRMREFRIEVSPA